MYPWTMHLVSSSILAGLYILNYKEVKMKTTISVILEDRNLENLEKEAEKENRSRSNMLNQILDEFFDKGDIETADEEF